MDDNAIIDDLAEAVKEKFADDLTGVSAPRLMVYSTGTAVPVPIGTEALDPGDNMTSLTTSKTPLIVVAPDDSDFRVPAKSRNVEWRIYWCITKLYLKQEQASLRSFSK